MSSTAELAEDNDGPRSSPERAWTFSRLLAERRECFREAGVPRGGDVELAIEERAECGALVCRGAQGCRSHAHAAEPWGCAVCARGGGRPGEEEVHTRGLEARDLVLGCTRLSDFGQGEIYREIGEVRETVRVSGGYKRVEERVEERVGERTWGT